jgi:hypothetical protein
MMTFADGIYAREMKIVRIVRKLARQEIAKFWRELARPVTFFDLCSPLIFFGSEIGEFFRNWRARQDSNLRPPA